MQLPLLYPRGRAIATAKKHDLLDLLQFIPDPEHKKFYATLDLTDMDPDDIIVLDDGNDVGDDEWFLLQRFFI